MIFKEEQNVLFCQKKNKKKAQYINLKRKFLEEEVNLAFYLG